MIACACKLTDWVSELVDSSALWVEVSEALLAPMVPDGAVSRAMYP